MKRAIDSLKIYCPNRSKGCDKITTLGECNKHLEKCLFVEVCIMHTCTKKCGERMLRKELQDHEDNKCPNRRVQCQYKYYCTLEGMHKEPKVINKIMCRFSYFLSQQLWAWENTVQELSRSPEGVLSKVSLLWIKLGVQKWFHENIYLAAHQTQSTIWS